jgi:hypothetical protein
MELSLPASLPDLGGPSASEGRAALIACVDLYRRLRPDGLHLRQEAEVAVANYLEAMRRHP